MAIHISHDTIMAIERVIFPTVMAAGACVAVVVGVGLVRNAGDTAVRRLSRRMMILSLLLLVAGGCGLAVVLLGGGETRS